MIPGYASLYRSQLCDHPVLPVYRPLPAWRFEDYLGWTEQGDGKLAYGLFIQNGRIKGEMKKALRKVWPPAQGHS